MLFNYARLLEGMLIPDVLTEVITNPANTITFIRTITLHNTSNSPVTVTLHDVPNNGVADNAAAFYERPIPAKGTVIWEYTREGLMLIDPGDSLQVVASIAAAVNIRVTGGVK